MTIDNRQRYLDRRKNSPPIPKKIKVPEKDNMGLFTVFMVVSFILSIMFFVVTVHKIDVSNFGLFQLIFGGMAVGFLIPIKLYRKKFTMSFYEYVIYNIICFAPVSIILLFLLNFSFHGGPYVETYPIESIEKTKEYYIFSLKDNKYEGEEYLRTIYKGNYPNIRGQKEYSIYLTDGYFGLRVIRKKLAH